MHIRFNSTNKYWEYDNSGSWTQLDITSAILTSGPVIVSSNFLGVGTTPSYPLHVSTNASYQAYFSNISGISKVVLHGTAGNGGDLVFREGSSFQWGIRSSGVAASSVLGFYPADGSTAVITIAQDGLSTFTNAAVSRASFVARSADSGVGQAALVTGTAGASGYLDLYNSSGTRLGYLGLDNTNFGLTPLNGAKFKVFGDQIITGALEINTSLLIANTSSSPGTIQNITTANASNDTRHDLFKLNVGTHGTYGPLYLMLSGYPSATPGNRYGAIQVGDLSDYRSLVLQPLGANVGIGTTAPDMRLDIDAGAIEFAEMTAPSNGSANTARLFARDNGSGKTQLCVIFSSGAVQVLVTEP